MILFSRSISLAISCRNSRYISGEAFSSMSRESARTFIEVMGVFSSWETFETNSWREASRALARRSTWLKASAMCSVSTMAGAWTGSLENPMRTAPMSRDSFSKGCTNREEMSSASEKTSSTITSSIFSAFRPRISCVLRMDAVETLASMTPRTSLRPSPSPPLLLSSPPSCSGRAVPASPLSRSADVCVSWEVSSIESVAMIGVTDSMYPSLLS